MVSTEKKNHNKCMYAQKETIFQGPKAKMSQWQKIITNDTLIVVMMAYYCSYNH